MNISIRQAHPHEAGLLTALAMRSKQSNGYGDEFMALCREELTVTAQRISAADFRVAELVERDNIICGCVELVIDDEGDEAEVCSFFIDPDHKRKGIGHLLWQDLLQLASQKGVRKLYLDADPSAVAFYEAQGFRIVGQVPSGSISGRTLPHMTINL